MIRWTGKVALVTGASAGIGAAIAVDLANHGMKVVGLARRPEKVEELKQKITGGEIHPLRADLSKEEDIVEAFKWIKNKFGTVHVLVNNAGIYRPGPLLTLKSNHIRDVFEVNVVALTLCTQQAFHLMKESGVNDGHIIFINSVVGHRVTPLETPISNVYPSSKYAVTALRDNLRLELRSLGTNIRVSSLSPGIVDTEIFETGAEAVSNASAVASLSTEPRLQAEDISQGVVYILSTAPHVQVHELIINPLGSRF